MIRYQVAPVATPDIEWSLVWPFTILALAGVVLITITSLLPRTRTGPFPAGFTAASAVVAAATIPFIANRVDDEPGRRFTVLAGAIVVDNFTLFITAVLCVSVVLSAFTLDDYLRREGLESPEWYALILLSASGGVLLSSAEDLIVAFVGLEILSIAVYVLAALHLRRSESQEAGFKYFVLGALSSAVFLYGIALVYGATGHTTLEGINRSLFVRGMDGVPATESSMLLVGIAFMLVGFGFKVSAAPFHLWTPDVYQGAPTPVTGFMASTVKVAAFGGFLRVFIFGFVGVNDEWLPIVAALAVLSLVIGSFLAVVQSDVKRMFAFSSITHAGFMLIGLHSAASDGPNSLLGSKAILFYLFTYAVMVLGTFAVITIVGGRGDANHHVDAYRGLATTEPVIAGLFAVLLFAQAGIPFTSGFWAKFRVITAASENEQYWLAAVAMLAAVVGAYLYLRVVVAMYLSGPVDSEEAGQAGGEGSASDAADGSSASDGAGDGNTAVVTLTRVPVSAGSLRIPPTALTVVAVSAIVTLAFGIFPDIGVTFLDSAANALLRP